MKPWGMSLQVERSQGPSPDQKHLMTNHCFAKFIAD